MDTNVSFEDYTNAFQKVNKFKDNVNELFNFIALLDQEKKQKNNYQPKYVFRGISKELEKNSKIVREFGDIVNDTNFVEKHEIRMLRKLEQNGSLYFYNSINNVFDFVSTAQHYGLPTRLLDWTYNPYSALLFSMFKNPSPDDDYYQVLFLDINQHIRFFNLPISIGLQVDSFMVEKPFYTKFYDMIRVVGKLYDKSTSERDKKSLIDAVYKNTSPDRYTSNSFLHDKTKKVVKKFENNRLLFIEPKFINERIAAQQGLFLFPNSLSLNELTNKLDEHCNIIKIHKSLRFKVIKRLEAMGHNIYKLIPDLPNICSAILTKELSNF